MEVIDVFGIKEKVFIINELIKYMEGKNKKILNFILGVFLIMFLLFAPQIDAKEGEEEQEEDENLKLYLNTTITVISDEDFEFEIKFFAINISSAPRKIKSSFAIPMHIVSSPEAKWSTLYGMFWYNFESIDSEEKNLVLEIKDNFYEMRRKREVTLKPGQKDGFRIKSIREEGIGEIKNDMRGFEFSILSGSPIYTNTLEIRIPLKEGFFGKLSEIDSDISPDESIVTEDYKILRWNDPIKIEEGKLINNVLISYKYETNFWECLFSFVKEGIKEIILGIIVGSIFTYFFQTKLKKK